MADGDHIKVRVITAFKRRLLNYAKTNRTTISALTRDALARSMDSALDVDQLKLDMISVRRASNVLKRFAGMSSITSLETSAEVEALALQLKRIATRYMGAQ